MLDSIKKHKLLLLSLMVILSVAVGVTTAFLIDITNDVNNEFKPGSVTCEVKESFVNNVKSNVSVENTGNIDAYIRAKVVVTWQNEQGDVYGKTPVEGTDYTMTDITTEGTPDTNWVYNEEDGFFYYTERVSSVAGQNTTGVLIYECEPLGTAPDGYYLSVEILASAIQADGVSTSEVIGPVGEKAIENAWGVNLSDLKNQ